VTLLSDNPGIGFLLKEFGLILFKFNQKNIFLEPKFLDPNSNSHYYFLDRNYCFFITKLLKSENYSHLFKRYFLRQIKNSHCLKETTLSLALNGQSLHLL
jgi:hypothetical protein